MAFFTELFDKPYQLWLIIAGLLLAAEMLGVAGYALWSGVAAAVVALITLIVPISGSAQWIIFSILTVAVAIAWWKWQQLKTSKKEEAEYLNRPYLSFIGQKYTLIEPVVNGYGRVKVADSSWRVKCNTDLPAQTEVIVENIDGNTLIVKPASA